MQQKSANNLLTLLVRGLVQEGIIKSQEVQEAMMSVDRGEFCNSKLVYEDCPQLIGYNATISAPHMHAYALEFLKDHLPKAEKVLDVGSGSGYLVAAMYKMMKKQENPRVYGIEHISELVTISKTNLNKSFKKEIDAKILQIIEGDGREGLPEYAPYDVIHVGAAAPEIPVTLLNQLKNGGRMLIPVGTIQQSFKVIDKDMDGKVSITDTLGVRYVPLTSKEKQYHQ